MADQNRIAVTVAEVVRVDKATRIALQIEGDGKANDVPSLTKLDELQELQRHRFHDYVPDLLFWTAAVRQKCPVSLCPGL